MNLLEVNLSRGLARVTYFLISVLNVPESLTYVAVIFTY